MTALLWLTVTFLETTRNVYVCQVYTLESLALIAAWLNDSQRSQDGVGMKCLSSPKDWILRYIRAHLYLFSFRLYINLNFTIASIHVQRSHCKHT